MSDLIDEYFVKHLSLSREEAYRLHQQYYKDYGLAIEGLVRHHKIDPLEYNLQVDDALPLQDILVPDPELRNLLENIDKSKVKMWLFTNAYITHGQRVVKLLGVDDLFEGITYCDYAAETLLCKPDEKMFAKAMKQAGIDRYEDCYFVGKCRPVGVSINTLIMLDDSALNCKKAQEIGWNVAHLVEEDNVAPVPQAAKHQIKTLQQLKTVFPHLFKSS